MSDTEVGGQQIKQGERVGLVYSSANFDEDVFDEPHRFDIMRDPNPHVGFGGNGPTTASAPTWRSSRST
jgi:cholest-4-en-3-one 26-monooxygenase